MEFIEMQKANAKALNYQQLEMQKEEKNYIARLNDPRSHEQNQAKMQAAHNAQINQYEEAARRANQNAYKNMLDQ